MKDYSVQMHFGARRVERQVSLGDIRSFEAPSCAYEWFVKFMRLIRLRKMGMRWALNICR